jgi:DUF1009 family protein
MAEKTGPMIEGAPSAQAAPVAIVCGAGRLPLQVAKAAVARGRPVFLLGITGIADPAIAGFPHTWIKLGQGGRAHRLLWEQGCREICFIGGLTRPSFSSLSFDWRTIRVAARVAKLFIGGDDRLLSGIITIVEQEGGIKVVAPHEVAPEILAPEGPLGRRQPSERDLADIRIGLSCLRAMSAHDVGQAVVVGRGHVLAVEAAEGTDAMLQRVAELRRLGRIRLPEGTGVLVKAPKAGQDRRIDLPALGPRTVQGAAGAGLAGIAVTAGATVVAEPDELAATADRAKLFVVGVPEESR